MLAGFSLYPRPDFFCLLLAFMLGHVHMTVPWLNIGAHSPVRGFEREHGSESTCGWALSFYNQILEGALGHGAMFCGMEVNH